MVVSRKVANFAGDKQKCMTSLNSNDYAKARRENGAAMERAKIEARMRETVRNLKAMGLGPDEISKITGVTPEEME